VIFFVVKNLTSDTAEKIEFLFKTYGINSKTLRVDPINFKVDCRLGIFFLGNELVGYSNNFTDILDIGIKN